METVTNLQHLRIWRDETMNRLWRLAYHEGDGETIIAFPDTAALGDFIAEQLGLELTDDLLYLPEICYTDMLDEDIRVN